MSKPKRSRVPSEATKAVDAAEAALRARGSAHEELARVNAGLVEAARAVGAATQRFLAAIRSPAAALSRSQGIVDKESTISRAAYEAALEPERDARRRQDESVRSAVEAVDRARNARATAGDAAYEAVLASLKQLRAAAAAARQVDEPKREQILELWNRGEPAKCIADKVGVSTRTVESEIAKLRKAGKIPQARPRKR